jgi:hypothetical protein
VIDVVHPCGEILAWHKAADVWIQRIRVVTTYSLRPLKRMVLLVLQETFRTKKSRMITKRVSCESSGYSVARHAAPLLGMSDLHEVKITGGE